MALDWLYEKPSCTTCDSSDNCFTRLTRYHPPDYDCYTPNERAQAWLANNVCRACGEVDGHRGNCPFGVSFSTSRGGR